MSSQVFYRKWRSRTLSELVGQPHVTQTLLNALKNGTISHAYLFCGPRGTGKTSTARILAKAVNCLTNNGRGEPCNECEMCRAIAEDRAMDVIEIDAASNRGIDDIRDLREKVNYTPSQARRKVYIIDEFHMLSKDASNALLKTLEEPPPHVIFVLATTEAHKVLPTILSRCQHFDFHRLSRSDVAAKLAQVCTAEKINIEAQSLQLIARSSTGSLRDAYNLLEQLTTFYGADIHYAQLQAMLGITGDWRVKEMVKHILKNDLTAGINTLINVNNDGLDLHQFNREMVEFLRCLMLAKTGASEVIDLPAEDVAEMKEMASGASLSQILDTVKVFGQIQLGNQDTSTLPLELALVEVYLHQTGSQGSEKKTESVPVASPNAVASKPAAAKAVSVPAAVSETKKPEQVSPGLSPVTEKAAAPAAKTEEKASPGVMGAEKASPGVIGAEKASPGVTATEKAPLQAAEAKPAAAPEAPVKSEAAPPFKNVPVASPTLASEIERLKFNWKQILDSLPETVKRKGMAVALLRTVGPPSSLVNGVVILSAKAPIFKNNIEKPENLQVIENIISDYLGHPCKVECILDEKKHHLVDLAVKKGAQVTSRE
jgi:DNA polymerase III subunit gamma/tau